MATLRVWVWTCGLLLLAESPKAQYYYYNDRYFESAVSIELGGSAGIMNSFTDLGGKKGIGKGFIKDLNWKNTTSSYSIYVLAMYHYAVGLRLEVTFGSVQGADSILKPVAATTYGRYDRNLSFKSRITDMQLAFEIHPLLFRNYDEDEFPKFSPFVVGGIGLFSFDPQARLKGQWYSLQPLRTEGQGFKEYPGRQPYKLRQFNFPIGIGVRYEVNSFLYARLELVHRILMTDYLDDVSTRYINAGLFPAYLPANLVSIAQQLYDRQAELNSAHIPREWAERGDPTDKDAFFSIQLKIGMVLGRQRR